MAKDGKDDNYPEHEKLMEVKDKSGEIGTFVEWVEDSTGYKICKKYEFESYGVWPPACTGELFISKLLAKFYGIDLEKLEEEKRKMMEAVDRAII